MPFLNCMKLGHLMAIWSTHVTYTNDYEKKLSRRSEDFKTDNTMEAICVIGRLVLKMLLYSGT